MKIHQKRLLDKGKIEKLVGVLRSIASRNPTMAEKIRTAADYSKKTRSGCAIPGFVANTCLLAGSDRSRLQDCDRLSSQTIGNVLDRQVSLRDLGTALRSS